jgi:hypothetical protein
MLEVGRFYWLRWAKGQWDGCADEFENLGGLINEYERMA